jgi:hypothetical protein
MMNERMNERLSWLYRLGWVWLLWLSACQGWGANRIGAVQTSTVGVPLAGAERAVVSLFNGVGGVRLRTADTAVSDPNTLLSGTLTYNVAEWEPVVSYELNSTGEEMVASVRQPELLTGLGLEDPTSVTFTYDLTLNPDIPTSLSLEMGIGTAEIDLANQHLTHLLLRMGAGQGVVDLSQIRPANLDVLLLGGLGRTTLLLPQDMGVKVTVQGGLSQINTEGLLQRDEVTFVNEAYHTAVPVLNIIIEPALGVIDLQVVP